jgi:hypothetical protein
MCLHRLIVGIDRLTEIRSGLMPVRMADLLLQRFPGGGLGVLLWRVGGEVDYGETGMGREPLLYLVAGMVRRLIEPQQDLPVGMLLQDQLQPARGGLTILPVDDKTTDFLAGAEMDGPINVLRLLTPRSIRPERLLPERIPAPRQRPFSIDLALIPGQRHDRLAAGGVLR